MAPPVASLALPATGSTGRRRLLLLRLLAKVNSRSALSFVAGALLVTFTRALRELLVWRRVASEERLWRKKVDFSVIQACVMSTEHLQSLGRVEKRTLFVKPIREFFCNEYVLARVLEAAERAASTEDPVLATQLDPEDKWHVLTTCTNHMSSCFAPYHVFFNEARRADSYYKSAWYCFTLTCAQTNAPGRWFITPNKPVMTNDVGMLRIRIVLMNEQELREIAGGAVEPPEFGFFNGRHASRWKVCYRIAQLFERQLASVTGEKDLNADWGANLCGSVRRKPPTGLAMKQVESASRLDALNQELSSEDNAILRLHIPFPSTFGSAANEGNPERKLEECVAKDVVLFE